MKIWIDADGCPRPVKELVLRASERLSIPVVMVADRPLARQRSPLISSVVVPRDMDSADRHIVEQVDPADLVITSDLPLAALVVGRGATAINPRGEIYTEDNVRERLSYRDFAMALREAGQDLGGPPPFSRKDKDRFAAALDRHLTRCRAGQPA
ncbi:MAG: YaiI/YqxD family protein [Desulfarculus sp.]|nr:YaiI/YqxD family protein [Desulfarculus sp.]